MAQTVKNLSAVKVLFLGWEDLLEKQMATYSSILVWRISWTEEPGGLQSIGLQKVRHDGNGSTGLAGRGRDCSHLIEKP